MGLNPLGSACLLAAIAVLVWGQSVDFYNTNGDCSLNSNVSAQCGLEYNRAINLTIINNNFTLEVACRLIAEWVGCVETGMCHCNFSSTHPELEASYRLTAWISYFYNNLTQCANPAFGPTFQPIDVAPGVDCSKYNKDAVDLPLIVALAENPVVKTTGDACAGVKTCVQTYDTEVNMHLYNQDIVLYCTATEVAVDCMVAAACDCDLNNDDMAIQGVNSVRAIMATYCNQIVDAVVLVQTGIPCPDQTQCEKPQPGLNCLLDYNTELSQSTMPDQECAALLNWAECTEKLVCDCGFFQEQIYLVSMATIKFAHSRNPGCSTEMQFPEHEGYLCASNGSFTEAETLFTLTLSEVGFVMAEEEKCPGIIGCFNDTLDDYIQAHRSKDLATICTIDAERITCLKQKYCQCNTTEAEVDAILANATARFNSLCVFAGFSIPTIPCLSFDCASPTVQNTCGALWSAIQQQIIEPTSVQFCELLHDFISCTEMVACECGFYHDPIYYQHLARAKLVFQQKFCAFSSSPFPDHKGLICSTENGVPVPERLISIALADTAEVLERESTCPGIKECYAVADAQATVAYANKDLDSMCLAEKERIECVEEKYCKCGQLFDGGIFNHTISERVDYFQLCSPVAEQLPVMRCRGNATCNQHSPLFICQFEYDWEFQQANGRLQLVCQATKNYLTCVEQVGCACGLLNDGRTEAAAIVYNLTTITLKVYEDSHCESASGEINPDENGIMCADTPSDDALRQLVLSFADSSEAAALAGDCDEVIDCFQTHDRTKATALFKRDYVTLCAEQEKLVDCLDEAYCGCRLEGTKEDYITTQVNTHTAFCGNLSPINRKECVHPTTEATTTTTTTSGAGKTGGRNWGWGAVLLLSPFLHVMTASMTVAKLL